MKKQDIALKKSAELWNAFIDIPLTEMHSDDTNDFRHHLHALQNILYTQLYKNQERAFKVTFNPADLVNGTGSCTAAINNTIKTF